MLYWYGMGATGNTTAAIQGYLDELAGLRGDSPAEPVVRSLLAAAAGRLHQLCANLLYRSYPRLARAPLNLQSDDMLSAVIERLMKALRQAHPGSVRQFYKIANQHMRWELNDLARRLDERMPLVALGEAEPASPQSSASQLSPIARRIFQVIDELPEDEREVFELVRIQGMTHREAAECVGVAERTVERRLTRGLLLLRQQLGELSMAEMPLPET